MPKDQVYLIAFSGGQEKTSNESPKKPSSKASRPQTPASSSVRVVDDLADAILSGFPMDGPDATLCMPHEGPGNRRESVRSSRQPGPRVL
jgi:hypothetical protein